METQAFLARVIAPGAYIAVNFKTPGKGMGVRFFPRADTAGAAGFIKWAAKRGMDAWHACASYRLAVPDGVDGRGQTKFSGAREQANVQQLKAFWIDVDVKRQGDGKAPEHVYPDIKAACEWVVKGFLALTKLPPPTLWVSSGYGLHLYWVLVDPLAPAQWQPYADAMAEAMRAAGFRSETGITIDSARILRPPGSLNYKVPAQPQPVSVVRAEASDYANAVVLQALQPWVGLKAQQQTHAQVGAAQGAPQAAVAITGNVSPLFANRQTNIAAAAQANLPAGRPFMFAEIAKKCGQVRDSLASQGAGDVYQLWYLGHLTLTHFCQDGAQFIHPISQGDPRYRQADTDAAAARIAAEVASKGRGPPTCAHFNRCRPQVCQACSHWGRLHSPISLGIDNPDADLPDGYRRQNAAVQKLVPSKDGPSWVDLVGGDIYGPVLDRVGDTHVLTFQYERAGRASAVIVDHSRLPTETGKSIGLFGSMGVTVDRHNALEFGDLIVAWINKLRDMRAEREVPVPPFGWVVKGDGTTVGLSVGGTLYRVEGGSEPAPGADRELVSLYRPSGDLKVWQQACDTVIKGRVDLQVIVAAAFGAPLMKFTGEPGLFVSVHSRDSGVGKSSAFKIAQTVWAGFGAMCSMTDTANAVRKKMGDAKVMPIFWDEMWVDKDRAKDAVNMIFELTQGKDKARLSSDASLRATGSWQTLMVVSGNRPLMDMVVTERNATDAGALRVFEIGIDHPSMPLNASVGALIGKCEHNHGLAGAQYGAWLAANVANVEKAVLATSKQLTAQLSATANERFHVAGMSCILVGAQIAHRLGLVAFDLKGLQQFLHTAFLALRAERRELVVANGALDVERILAGFLGKHQPYRLVTSSFLRPGQPKPGNGFVVLAPLGVGQLAIHISQHDRMMRIDRDIFAAWCRTQGFVPSDVLQQMGLRWAIAHGSKYRGLLGAGTPYVSARVYFIQIPLQTPELAGYIFDNAASPPACTPTVKGLPGNQSKV